MSVECPTCHRDVASEELIVDDKCGWCHLEAQREADGAAFEARRNDHSWNGIAAEHIRAERDRQLASSDWTQTNDQLPTVRESWAGYRQALRDIPETFESPDDVVWPEPPV